MRNFCDHQTMHLKDHDVYMCMCQPKKDKFPLSSIKCPISWKFGHENMRLKK